MNDIWDIFTLSAWHVYFKNKNVCMLTHMFSQLWHDDSIRQNNQDYNDIYLYMLWKHGVWNVWIMEYVYIV